MGIWADSLVLTSLFYHLIWLVAYSQSELFGPSESNFQTIRAVFFIFAPGHLYYNTPFVPLHGCEQVTGWPLVTSPVWP